LRIDSSHDLECCDALDRDARYPVGDGIGQGDVDLARGQHQLADLVDERQDDDPPPRTTLRFWSRPEPCRAGADDEGLVRAGDLVAAADARLTIRTTTMMT
jgi:hypothetical protein